MKVLRVLAIGAISVCMLTTTIFAADSSTQNGRTTKDSTAMQMRQNFGGRQDKGREMPGEGKMMGKGGQMPGAGFMGKGEGTNISSLLSSFVTDGTISQETLDNITAFIKEKQDAQKAEMEKVKAMTADERKAYFESKKADLDTNEAKQKPEMFKELIDAGLLTQEQADTISAKLEDQRQAKQEEQQAKQQEQMESRWGKLVESNIITQDEADKIITFMQEKHEVLKADMVKMQEERKAEMEKIKAMTEEERTAYFESKKADFADGAKNFERPQKQDQLSELVDAGLLTQEQVDAIKAAMPQNSCAQGFKGKANFQGAKKVRG